MMEQRMFIQKRPKLRSYNIATEINNKIEEAHPFAKTAHFSI